MKILFFGKLKERVGRERLEIKGIRELKELKKYLIKKYPQLKNETFFISVNQKIVNKNVELKEKDEIAFLPPVSGG